MAMTVCSKPVPFCEPGLLFRLTMASNTTSQQWFFFRCLTFWVRCFLNPKKRQKKWYTTWKFDNPQFVGTSTNKTRPVLGLGELAVLLGWQTLHVRLDLLGGRHELLKLFRLLYV